MQEFLTFNDVLIQPKFSTVESRKDVDLSVDSLGLMGPKLKLPVISANMDTVTTSEMAIEMGRNGAIGCLHRFWGIEDNVRHFRDVTYGAGFQVMCSMGLGKNELERAEALVSAGAKCLVLDVAHGASVQVAKQVIELRNLFKRNVSIVVGNFATMESVRTFLEYHTTEVDGIKVGIGPGSICKTRTVTGVGYPQLSAICNVRDALLDTGIALIADGGMSTSGDIAKALGAGAHMVMLGGMLAGTYESPGEVLFPNGEKVYSDEKQRFFDERGIFVLDKNLFKKYRGSASKEAYESQGKTASHRAPEGEEILVPYKGPVANILQEIEGGLRSAFTYTDSRNLKEFHRNVEFIKISSNTVVENGIRK